MSLERLGYFMPGHSETICHVEGRNHPLARTALHHEEAHENLTSWSTSGLFSTHLTLIDEALSHTRIPPDPITCLELLMNATRRTHEGFATFSQLIYIGLRFGMKASYESFGRLPPLYRDCATPFLALFNVFAGDDPFFFQPPAIVAVRAFALVALNIDIFQRVGSFHAQIKSQLSEYLADSSSNPDARFDVVIASVFNGEVNTLLTTLRTMLRKAIKDVESLQHNPPAQKVSASRFSQQVNAAVLEHYSRRISVDLTILNPEGIRAAVDKFTSSAASHYGFDATRLLARLWLPNDPVVKLRFKTHRVEFADAELSWQQPFGDMHAFESFLRRHDGHVVVTVAPQDVQGSVWMVEAAARIDTAEFKTGVLTCRSASTNLSQILYFLRYYDTALVVMEGLVHTSEEWKDCLLSETHRLYIFATRVSVVHVEDLARDWLGDSCSALILTEAFGHHALMVIGRSDRAHRIIAIVAEDVVDRFKRYLSPTLGCQTRKADPLVDEESMLAAWVYSYGPCSNWLRQKDDR